MITSNSLLDRGLGLIYRLVRSSPRDYVEVETTADDTTLVFKDCTHVSIIRFEGIRSLVGGDEFANIVETLAESLRNYVTTPHHKLSSHFSNDHMTVERVKEQMQPMYDTATRFGMNSEMHDILDDQANTMAKSLMQEDHHLALWTFPTILNKRDLQTWRDEQNDLFRKGLAPNPRQAQDGTRAIPAIAAEHHRFVLSLLGAIKSLKGNARLMQVDEAVYAQKDAVERRLTPRGWRPWLLSKIGERPARSAPERAQYTQRKDGSNVIQVGNLAALFPPSLARQIIGSNLIRSKERGYPIYGERMYVTLVMDLPPRTDTQFRMLMNYLRAARVNTPDGQRPLPFRFSVEIAGDPLKWLGWRSMFAAFTPFTDDTKHFNKAIKYLKEQITQANEPGVRYSFSISTWVDADMPEAEMELAGRVTKLTAAARQWGSASVVEYGVDRFQAFISNSLALTRKSVGNFAATDLSEALRHMPLDRPASPFLNAGVEIYRSLDGRMMTTTSHSSEMDYSLQCDVAGMGGGKSVQANRRHLEFVLQPGLTGLPFLHVMDVGESASGTAYLVQDALPDNMKHLAYFVRLQNTKEFSINMLDTPYGLRYPPAQHMSAIADWLTAYVTPAERTTPFESMSAFVQAILRQTYAMFDDANDQGKARKYLTGFSKDVDAAIMANNITAQHEFTSWWAVVDALHAAGCQKEAMLAQRFASPRLGDVESVASDDNVVAEFKDLGNGGIPIARTFLAQLRATKDAFPIFNDFSRVDLRGRRFTVLDLHAVTGGESDQSRKQTSLMYSAAYELFTRNIRFHLDDLQNIPSAYQKYYATLIEDLMAVPKHITIDEYHRTSSAPPSVLAANPSAADEYGLRKTLQREAGKEARKWKLSVTTISQRPGDHGGLLALASSVFLMKTPEKAEDVTLLVDKMELNESGVFVMKRFLNGPQAGVGVTLLGRFNLKDERYTQLMTSTIGPKLMWATSTTPEDKTIRTFMYDQLGKITTRSVLAFHYPGGSAKAEVERRKASKGPNSSVVDGNQDKSAERMIAEELIGLYRADPTKYQIQPK